MSPRLTHLVVRREDLACLRPGDVIRKEHFSTRPTLTVRAIDTHWNNGRLIYQYEQTEEQPGTWDYVHIIDPMIGTSVVVVAA